MNKELEDQFYITHRELDNSGNIHKAFNEMHKLMLMFILEIEKKESDMDKKINKLAKHAEKEVKGLKSLAKEDKKRDKVVDRAKKVMKKKGC